MGSFDATCAVSNLPISSGDKVKAFLVTQNPYIDSNNDCYVHDQWIPRTFAIDAEYNDYGSIEKYANDALTKVWLMGLQNDLIEVGTGDNSCHDVPTSKGMKFEEFLEALWERRAIVNRNYGRIKPEDAAKLADKYKDVDYSKDGEISLQKARKILENVKGALVDALPFGPIRVRLDGYSGKTSELEALLPYFMPDYQPIVVAGSGSYAKSEGEIWVINKPSATQNFRRSADVGLDRPQALPIRLSLIRKDVWDTLVAVKRESYDRVSYKTIYLTLADELASVKAVWDADLSFNDELPKDASADEINVFFTKRMARNDSRREHLFTANEAGVLGLAYHWDLMIQAAKAGKLSEKEIKSFQLCAAEMSMAWCAMSRLRIQFKPFYTAGPQFGDYKAHAKFNKALGKIAADIYKKQREDWGE